MKRCRACQFDKPLEDFQRRRSAPDGHQYYCRECSRSKVRSSMQVLREDPEYRRQEVLAENQRYQEDPEYRARKIARSRAMRALQRGDIEAQPCEVCTSTEVEMHHDDYNQPLEVRWFCREHHLHEHYDPFEGILARLDQRQS